MNLILALLKKEFISFKNQYMIFFIYVILFPLVLFLFFSIPLSMVFVSIKPIYIIWSSSGVHVVTTMITSFLISVILLNEKMKKEFFFTAPIPISSFIISTYIFILIIALVQFFVSVMLISFLSDSFLSIVDFLLIFMLLIPSIFVVCSLSLITACYIKKSIVKTDCILRLGCHNIRTYKEKKRKSVFRYDIDKSYVIHLASRSLKDTLIKSICSNMNYKKRGTNYTNDSINNILNNNELPIKFKLIAFYNKLCNSNKEYVVNLNNDLLKIDYSYENKLIGDVNYDLLKEIYYKQKFKIYKSIHSRLGINCVELLPIKIYQMILNS